MEEELSYEGSYRSPEALYDPFRRRSMMMRKTERKRKGEKEMGTRRGNKDGRFTDQLFFSFLFFI